jgi:transcriptional regulator with XRE-family HTH domain
MNNSKKYALPLNLSRALKKLGEDLALARRVRRISASIMSERTSISRVTLNKIEKGDPSVAFGSYAMVMYVLGLTDKISDLIDLKNDPLGLELTRQKIPQRIRKYKKV